MNELQHYRMQEDAGIGAAMLENLNAILGDCINAEQLDRDIYWYTECGAFIAVRLHNGKFITPNELSGVMNGDVSGILIGSIVEGSDAEVSADWINLIDYETPESAVDAFNDALEWVNAEACALWNESNQGETE